jgi:threonine/homoserine/homoserine lactone efflux protein
LIEAIGTAILLGFILSFSLGPIFFELINTSLRRGFKTAFFLEVGVLMSDIIYLVVAYFSAEKVLKLIEGNDYFKIIGGAIFVVFGLVSILKNILKKKEEPVNTIEAHPIDETILDKENYADEKIVITKNIKTPSYVGQIMKGIALNAINPSVLLFWIITCSATIKSLEGTHVSVGIFFAITLLVMFGIDITKIYFASKLKKHMTPKILATVGIVIGCIMVVAGIIIIFKKFDIPGATL